MLLIIVLVLLLGFVDAGLVKFKVEDHSQIKEISAHFKPLHRLPDGVFIAEDQPLRRDLKVRKLGNHTKTLIHSLKSRRIVVHGVLNKQKLAELVGTKGILIRERQFSDEPNAEKVYVITASTDVLLKETIVKLYKSQDILWFDFVRGMKPTNAEAMKVMMKGHPVHESGKNVIITIADTGLDVNHCMFRSDESVYFDTLSGSKIRPIVKQSKFYRHPKILAYLSVKYDENKTTDHLDELYGHGTHVAGSAAGSGCGDVVSGAKLIFFDIYNNAENAEFLSVPDVITPMLHTSYKMGSRVLSFSWGSIEEFYTTYDYELDKFVYEHPDYLCIIAAGNSGEDLGTIASPGVSKNCLTVGASLNSFNSFTRTGIWGDQMKGFDPATLSDHYTNEENIAYFSSRGPTSDGRIKPDLVGPGMFISSAAAGTLDKFIAMQGSSMITPLVARIMSMVIEYLTVRGFGNPTTALLKGLAVASTSEMTGSSQTARLYNDTLKFVYHNKTKLTTNDYGHGLFNPDRIFSGEFAFMDKLWLNETRNFTFAALRSQEVTFVMVHIDAPNLPGTIPCLVNNPDMFLLHESGEECTEYFPNKKSQLDDINNVEKITLRVSKGDRLHVRLIPGVTPDYVSFVRTASLVKQRPRSCVKTTARRQLDNAAEDLTRLSTSMLSFMWAVALIIGVFFDSMSVNYFLER